MENIKKKLQLHKIHLTMGAKIGVFGDFIVPMCYSNPSKEHLYTREYCSIFDVSHMFCLKISGTKALELIRKITPAFELSHNKCKYTVIVDNNCKIIDDIIIYPINQDELILTVNSINVKKCLDLINKYKDNSTKASILENLCIIAIQGPASEKELQNAMPNLTLPIKNMSFKYTDQLLISRSGYTGEKIGFEIMANEKIVKNIFEIIIGNKKTLPAGIIARNSLRLEAGFPLHGSDITSSMNPMEANLDWVISKNNTQFIGKSALEKFVLNEKNHQIRTSIIVKNEKAIIPPNSEIYLNDNVVGRITSSAYSPILESCIAQGLVLKNLIKSDELYVKKYDKKINITLCGNKINLTTKINTNL